VARIERWVPGLRLVRECRRSWLASDLIAGLVLTALLIPVGTGYTQAARLPPITGLYGTIVPLVAYAIFGPSWVMVLGPDSSLAVVIAAVILPLGGDDPETAVALTGALAVLTGLIILVVKRFWRTNPGVAPAVLVGIAAVLLFDSTPRAWRSSACSRGPPGLCLPLPMLAAIVITAAMGLIDAPAVRPRPARAAAAGDRRWPPGAEVPAAGDDLGRSWPEPAAGRGRGRSWRAPRSRTRCWLPWVCWARSSPKG
jgi:MFS superfamily sulfate permease-like transporter